jgi:hypothetical protein
MVLSPHVVAAETIRGGVVITFSNQEEGFYSDELLYASLPAARELLAKAVAVVDGSTPSNAKESLA